jgi:hypothetical protein
MKLSELADELIDSEADDYEVVLDGPEEQTIKSVRWDHYEKKVILEVE